MNQFRPPQLSPEERLLDCLLQQRVPNAREALEQLDDLDVVRPAERTVLAAIRHHVATRNDDGAIDKEAINSHLLEEGELNDDEVRRVVLNVCSDRTVPELLGEHIRAVHVARLKRAALSYAAGIDAKAKDGALDELIVMLTRFEHIQPLIDRVKPTTTSTLHAA